MEKNRKKFPQHIYIDLSEQNFEIYDKEDNKSALISKLLEEHYDTSIVKVKIDEKIKDAYVNDLFKEFRIPMLLLEFYMKGNIDGIKNEVSISLANKGSIEKSEEVAPISSSENKNTTEKIEEVAPISSSGNKNTMEKIEEVTPISSFENKNTTKKITNTDNQDIIKKTVVNENDIISSKVQTNETGDKFDDITKVFFANKEENNSKELTAHINIEHISSDIKEENNFEEPTAHISNNTKKNNNEVFKHTHKKTEENKTQVYDSETPRSGSLNDLLKGKKIPTNNKSIL